MTLHIEPELIQRSEEWYEQRRGMVTASVVGRLITVRKLGALDFGCPACEAPAQSPCRSKVKRDGQAGAEIKTLHPERTAVSAANKTTVIEPASNEDSRSLTALLVAERISGHTDATFVSADMWRGIEDEPRAITVYSEHYAPVETVGFMIREEDGFRLGYSPDGLVGDDGLIEVKSRRQGTHVLTVLSDSVPMENMAQIQAGLLVSGRKWCDYIDYCGGMHMFVKRVHPDPRWQRAIVAAVRAFEANAAEMAALYSEAVAGMPMTERVDNELGLVF